MDEGYGGRTAALLLRVHIFQYQLQVRANKGLRISEPQKQTRFLCSPRKQAAHIALVASHPEGKKGDAQLPCLLFPSPLRCSRLPGEGARGEGKQECYTREAPSV